LICWECLDDHEEVTNLQDVIEAWQAIAEAERRYRETLRAAIADGVQQKAIAEAIARTREKVRRDALPEDERERLLKADAERVRKRRQNGPK
jgi:hypothetical protein